MSFALVIVLGTQAAPLPVRPPLATLDYLAAILKPQEKIWVTTVSQPEQRAEVMDVASNALKLLVGWQAS